MKEDNILLELVSRIKNILPDQKAQRDIDSLMMELDEKPIRPSSGFKLKIKKDNRFRNTT